MSLFYIKYFQSAVPQMLNYEKKISVKLVCIYKTHKWEENLKKKM